MASSDLLYITDAAVFEDDPSFSKRTAGWHECPERYNERTCWSTSDSFVLFLTLPALLIHYPFLLGHLFLFISFLLSCWQHSFLSFLFLSNYPFIFIFVITESFTRFNSVYIYIFVDWLWWSVCCVAQHMCFSSLFLSSEGWICWKAHRGKFILDGLPVHVWVFGQCKCVVQRNKPIFSSDGVSVKFPLRLHACAIRPVVRSGSLIPSLSKLVKAFRQTKVTADFISNHIKLTTQGCSQLWAIFSLHLSVYLFSLFYPRSFRLPALLKRRIPIHDSPTYSFINMRASHVWTISWKNL